MDVSGRNGKNAIYYTEPRKHTVTYCPDRRMDKACGAKVFFSELRARQGPGWIGKMASAPTAPPMAAKKIGEETISGGRERRVGSGDPQWGLNLI